MDITRASKLSTLPDLAFLRKLWDPGAFDKRKLFQWVFGGGFQDMSEQCHALLYSQKVPRGRPSVAFRLNCTAYRLVCSPPVHIQMQQRPISVRFGAFGDRQTATTPQLGEYARLRPNRHGRLLATPQAQTGMSYPDMSRNPADVQSWSIAGHISASSIKLGSILDNMNVHPQNLCGPRPHPGTTIHQRRVVLGRDLRSRPATVNRPRARATRREACVLGSEFWGEFDQVWHAFD